MTNREELCKKFTELTGGTWHKPVGTNIGTCTCGKKYLGCPFNPEYTNPADVLRVMIKHRLFLERVGLYGEKPTIYLSYILEPDALLKAAVEFLAERKP